MDSLDDVLLQNVLTYLCDPSDVPAYAFTLLRCAQVNKFFHQVISNNDKLWGYWSVLQEQQEQFDSDDGGSEAGDELGANEAEEDETNAREGKGGTNGENEQEEASNVLASEVSEYGPNCKEYDERMSGWKELTLVKAAISSIQDVQSKEIEFDQEKMLFVKIVKRIYRLYRLDCNSFRDNSGFELREDAAEMLYSLVGEYLLRLFQGANHVITYGEQQRDSETYLDQLNIYCESNDLDHVFTGTYPVLNAESIEVAKTIRGYRMKSDWRSHSCYFGVVRSHDYSDERLSGYVLTEGDVQEFDSLIRKIAYRAGVVKLDTSAFQHAKRLYVDRIAAILINSAEETYHLRHNSSSIKPIISSKIDAFHVMPGWVQRKGLTCQCPEGTRYHDCGCLYDAFTYIPVPVQLEKAHLRLEHMTIHRTVFGIEGTTEKVENLEDYYKIQSGVDAENIEDANTFAAVFGDNPGDEDDTIFSTDEVPDDEKNEPGLLLELDDAANALDSVTSDLIETGRLDHHALSRVIATLTELNNRGGPGEPGTATNATPTDQSGSAVDAKRIPAKADYGKAGQAADKNRKRRAK